MERERIEMLIKHHELIRDRYAGSDFACTQQEVIEVLRLALLAIDSERARRVGEAVLLCPVEDFHYAIGALEDRKRDSVERFGGSVGSVMVVESCNDVIKRLSAIAAALRGEP